MKETLSVLFGQAAGGTDVVKAYLSTSPAVRGKHDLAGDFSDALRREFDEGSGGDADLFARKADGYLDFNATAVPQRYDQPASRIEERRPQEDTGEREADKDWRPSSHSYQDAPRHEASTTDASTRAAAAQADATARCDQREAKPKASEAVADDRKRNAEVKNPVARKSANESGEAAKTADARTVRKGADDVAGKDKTGKHAEQVADSNQAAILGSASKAADEAKADAKADAKTAADAKATAEAKAAALKGKVRNKQDDDRVASKEEGVEASKKPTMTTDHDAAAAAAIAAGKLKGAEKKQPTANTQRQVVKEDSKETRNEDNAQLQAQAQKKHVDVKGKEATTNRQAAGTADEAQKGKEAAAASTADAATIAAAANAVNATTTATTAEEKKKVRKASDAASQKEALLSNTKVDEDRFSQGSQLSTATTKSQTEKELRRDTGRDAKESKNRGTDEAGYKENVKVFMNAVSSFGGVNDADYDALRRVSQRFVDARPLAKDAKKGSGDAQTAQGKFAAFSSMSEVVARQIADAAELQSQGSKTIAAQTGKDILQLLANQGVTAGGKGGAASGHGSDMAGMFGDSFGKGAASTTTSGTLRQSPQAAPYTDPGAMLNTIKDIMSRLQSVLKDAAIDKSNFSLNVDTAQMGRIKLTLEERNDVLTIRVEVKSDANKEQLSQNKDDLAGEARRFGYREVNVDVSSGEDNSGSRQQAQQEGNENAENVKLAGREEFNFAAGAEAYGKDFLEVARAAVAGE